MSKPVEIGPTISVVEMQQRSLLSEAALLQAIRDLEQVRLVHVIRDEYRLPVMVARVVREVP